MTEQDLAGKGAVITGSSRGIGAATAQLIAERGAGVVVNYRAKAPRAKKVVKGIEEAGGQAVAVQADITENDGAHALVDTAVERFGSLDLLILNASGGMEADRGEDYALKLNRDAQVSLVRTALQVMPAGSQIVFVTSHQAHFINQTATMDAYEPVARSKRAGEDALREMVPELDEKGIRLTVVSGDMIEGTITATLLDRAQPGAIEARRAAAGKLCTVEEFAAEIASIVNKDGLQQAHTELVGGADDFLVSSA
ncbi:SDR family oxidoreductase [Nesterenkonia populi]|uniref:SDR family oxidoreductase n=1 Tax=Nesterenkonia populi TaxID=1591087 RepID=UPI0011BD95B8|nr:SDR family oxidoreductase [Nesterenkonia populi]